MKDKLCNGTHKPLSWLVSVLFWLVWIVNGLLSVWCCGAIWYQHWVEAAAGKGVLIGAFVLAEVVLMAMAAVSDDAAEVRSNKEAIEAEGRNSRSEANGLRRSADVATGKRRWWLLLAGAAIAGGVTAAWLGLQRPTGQHDWDPPFARMPKATFSPDGKTVTVENVRDFHYRTEDDYDIRYRTETYNIDELDTVDYSITHWNGNEPFGHIIISFGFRDGRYLAFSPEARMLRGKKYELLPGFFRQYELIFICATEEDVFQLRTHHRQYEQEEVFLYPVVSVTEKRRVLFTDLMKRMNALATQPEYYNGITYNCLSSLAPSAEKISARFCDGLFGTFNGFSDRIAWEIGLLRRTVPGESFADYKKRHSVNQYVEHLNNPTNYSQLIRPDLKLR